MSCQLGELNEAGLSPTDRYPMSTATDRTVSAPRWMLWTGWLFPFWWSRSC